MGGTVDSGNKTLFVTNGPTVAAGLLVISNVISGSGGNLSKGGNLPALTLLGSNTYSGTTVIAAGTLTLGDGWFVCQHADPQHCCGGHVSVSGITGHLLPITGSSPQQTLAGSSQLRTPRWLPRANHSRWLRARWPPSRRTARGRHGGQDQRHGRPDVERLTPSP